MAELGDTIIKGDLNVLGNVIFDSFEISGFTQNFTQNSSFHNNIYRGKDITAD